MKVSFTAMEHGTPADFKIIASNDEGTQDQLADRILAHLGLAEGDDGGYQINRMKHSIQAADRASAMGADDDWIFGTLLHDIGDTIAPDNHAAMAADVVAPYVRPEVEFTVRHHGAFQAYYYWHHIGRDRCAREKFRSSEFFEHAVIFCHLWDQSSFNPNYPTSDLEQYRDLVKRVCSQKPFSHHKAGSLSLMGVGATERALVSKIMKPI